MKRFLAFVFALVLTAALTLPVFADVAYEPGEMLLYELRTSIIPWIAIAVVIVAAALLVWFLVKRRRK